MIFSPVYIFPQQRKCGKAYHFLTAVVSLSSGHLDDVELKIRTGMYPWTKRGTSGG